MPAAALPHFHAAARAARAEDLPGAYREGRAAVKALGMLAEGYPLPDPDDEDSPPAALAWEAAGAAAGALSLAVGKTSGGAAAEPYWEAAEACALAAGWLRLAALPHPEAWEDDEEVEWEILAAQEEEFSGDRPALPEGGPLPVLPYLDRALAACLEA